MSATAIANVDDQPITTELADVDTDVGLSTMHTLPAAEQDEMLWRHGERVADHMANEFSRRLPHLAAKSGFTAWQRVAGAAVAIGAVALLAVAPTILSIILVSAITAITLTHVLIATLPGRGQYARRGSSQPAAVPEDALPTYTILIPAYEEQDVIGGMVRCLEALDYPKDRLEALILVTTPPSRPSATPTPGQHAHEPRGQPPNLTHRAIAAGALRDPGGATLADHRGAFT